jgi:hypothetical protein
MSTPAVPRGIRNNNPGNIRLGSPWFGLVPAAQQTDPTFCQFDTPVHGIRAMGKILCTYHDTYELNTIKDMISRWAPPNENDTAAYIANVAQLVGVRPTDTINIHDPNVLAPVVKAIIYHENGEQPYDDATIMNGVQLAAA